METDILAVTIGKNLTRLRKMANMTQLELAEKLNYSDKSVSKWEQGNGIPDVRILIQLSELFGVTLDDLVKEHTKKPVIPRSTKFRNRMVTVVLSSGLCWLTAVVIFVLWGLFGWDMPFKWLSFMFAIPANAVVVLVFSCIWHWKWARISSISVLIWTGIGCVYLVALAAGASAQLWLLFLIGVPLQILALFYFVWRKGARFRS